MTMLLVLLVPAKAGAEHGHEHHGIVVQKIHRAFDRLNWYRQAIGRNPYPYQGRAERPSSTYTGRLAILRQWRQSVRHVLDLWAQKTAGLRCIHQYEGAWNDPNPTYFGGLQMDRAFQWTYGRTAVIRWGTADHWPIRWQLRAGLRAVRSRGYSPWPSTRHRCGL